MMTVFTVLITVQSVLMTVNDAIKALVRLVTRSIKPSFTCVGN